MTDAFYIADGERFIAQDHTMGPWDERHQHAGPPAALLGRALETCQPHDDFRIARVTYEILRAIPIGPVEVSASLVRPGRSVQMLEAVLSVDGEPVMIARAWRMITAPETAPPTALDDAPPPGPETGHDVPFFLPPDKHGYHTGMEWRFVDGAFFEPGPATAWFRMRIPLVAGEEPSSLQRVLIAADTGNGISAVLDPRTHLFVNTDLTVNLLHEPATEWVALSSITRAHPDGVGIAESTLWDERGRIGAAIQTLLVRKR